MILVHYIENLAIFDLHNEHELNIDRSRILLIS